jgi:hypothetical protein
MATNAVLHHNTPVTTAQGLFHELDVYPNRFVIRRTDILSRLFGSNEIIAYDDIKEMHIHEEKFLNNHRVQFIIVTHHSNVRSLTYEASQEHLIQHIKETVEEFLSHRTAKV